MAVDVLTELPDDVMEDPGSGINLEGFSGSFDDDERVKVIKSELDNVEIPLQHLKTKDTPITEVHKPANAGIIPTQLNSSWKNSATVKDQFNKHPDSVKLVGVETKIFDLSNEAHLADYNELYTKSIDLDQGMRIMYEDKKFSTVSDTWKVLVTIGRYHFKQLQ